ncbi:MAG: hypothetical protein MI748_16470 [Opitutales bacterium]|nr:hypothetical protein [Opitutales bacterium]
MIKKFKNTLALSILAVTAFCVEVLTNTDLIKWVYDLHNNALDLTIPSIPLILLGINLDLISSLIRRKDREKTKLYRETMLGVNHLIRNLQNQLQILDHFETKSPEEEKFIELLREDSQQVESILKQLSDLKNLDPELVKAISSSNVKN